MNNCVCSLLELFFNQRLVTASRVVDILDQLALPFLCFSAVPTFACRHVKPGWLRWARSLHTVVVLALIFDVGCWFHLELLSCILVEIE